MKKILNSLLAVGGLLLLGGSLSMARAQSGSQGTGQSQAAPEQQNEARRPDLNLTDDQKAQMKKIHEDAKSQIEAVNNDSSLSDGQKHAKIQAIHRDTHKQVEAMLTPEQREKMRAWHQSHHGEKSQHEAPPSN